MKKQGYERLWECYQFSQVNVDDLNDTVKSTTDKNISFIELHALNTWSQL